MPGARHCGPLHTCTALSLAPSFATLCQARSGSAACRVRSPATRLCCCEVYSRQARKQLDLVCPVQWETAPIILLACSVGHRWKLWLGGSCRDIDPRVVTLATCMRTGLTHE
jgi:hypothetical protein